MFKVKQPGFQSFKTFNRCAPFKSLNYEHVHAAARLWNSQNVEMITVTVTNLFNL